MQAVATSKGSSKENFHNCSRKVKDGNFKYNFFLNSSVSSFSLQATSTIHPTFIYLFI